MHSITKTPRLLMLLMIILLSLQSISTAKKNSRPIIGILSQERSENRKNESYIAASYVKWVESGGARVAPILINQPHSYYETIFNSTAGLVLPGGSVPIPDSGYGRAARILWRLSMKLNARSQMKYPIWGTCLGMEMMGLLTASPASENPMEQCNSEDEMLPLNFVSKGQWEKSRLGGKTPEYIKNYAQFLPITVNFHRKCVTRASFAKAKLDKFWTILATSFKSVDNNSNPWSSNTISNNYTAEKSNTSAKSTDGKITKSYRNQNKTTFEFISLMEAKSVPVWASQFHPEKNEYEWNTMHSNPIAHSHEAVVFNSHLAQFFVEECRRGGHGTQGFGSHEPDFLIYNYQARYMNRENDNAFEQIYVFDAVHVRRWWL